MKFQENLTFLMERGDISNKGLAEIVGVSEEAVRKWRRGLAVPAIDKAQKVAEYFGVSLDKMLGGDVDTERSIKLPLVGLISAGVFDILNEEAWKEEREVSVRLLSDRPKKECVTMEVTGESMAPYLLPGDILVVHRQDYAVNGNIIIAYDPTVNGYTVKKFQQNGDTVILDPFNKEFSQIRYNNPKQQELDLYGVCVGLERKLV